MKQFFVSAVALLLSAPLFAGTIEFLDVPTTPVQLLSSQSEVQIDVVVKNTADGTKKSQGARTVNTVQGTQQSFYCWGFCLAYFADSTIDPVEMAAGTSQVLNVHFRPEATVGQASVTIRIYEETDPTNFGEFTIVFDALLTSTDPAHLGTTSLLNRAFPVPATDRITATYSLPQGAVGSLSLADLTGREVRAITLAAGTTEATLDLSGVAAGTYVLRMTADNRSTGTRIVTVK